MRILILGGYGVFGGRLAELISDMPDADILICGRTAAKAEKFCGEITGVATFTPLGLDRADIAGALTVHRPDIVIDASGPFQDYGDDPYCVIKACIAAGVHYMDFADAADFVFGISQFDDAAKAAGISVLSGVSSFPVLTAAVLRELGSDMTVQKVTGGIAPSPYAGIGLNVMRAVVGYAGGPVKLKRGGQDFTAKGLTESLRYTVSPPGFLPLRNLHFSLVDVPDLQVLPAQYPSITDIWMGAGPVPESLHRILNILAKLRAALRLPSFGKFSSLFYKVLNMMKYGEHRGGMFIEVEGVKDGETLTRSWHLLAEGDDGPYIPSMAVEALLRKWAKDTQPDAGARPATHELETSDYEALFETRDIWTGTRESAEPNRSLFKTVLGNAFKTLPVPIQDLHKGGGIHAWTGQATVKTGRNPLARFISFMIGLKVPAGTMPLRVGFTPGNDSEVWERNFDGHRFSSRFQKGTDRNTHLVEECFGPIRVALALVIKGDKLHFIPRRWSFLGLPMPQFLLPREDSFEYVKDGVFHFHVCVKVPIAGLIAAYDGWLKPVG